MKQTVLVVFGGESSEHDVSIASARNVAAALDRQLYDVHLCYISHDGRSWWLVPSFETFDGPKMQPLLGRSGFIVEDKTLSIDVMFPVLHGKFGEDGSIQGMAQLLHVPYVGPSAIGAAITMDKDVTKRLLRDAGIPVVDWLSWRRTDQRPDYEAVTKSLGRTLFVKPANAGSSVGVSKVTDSEGFETALTTAAQHDELVLIEQAIDGREIELAVLGNEHARVSTPGEVIADAEFYSYDAKYASDSESRSEIPADLPVSIQALLQTYASRAYVAVRGHGMARVDFFVTSDGSVYLNEINSIPGFTDISMYPKMWQHDGVSYAELLNKLIQLATKN